MLSGSVMKKQTDNKKPLLVSVDKLRDLTTEQLKAIAGGPCPHSTRGSRL